MVLSECRSIGAAFYERVRALCADHDEVIVAIQEGDALSGAPLPERWARARTLLAAQPKAWVTPLVTGDLRTPQERCAALETRLGRFTLLTTDDRDMLACAERLGLPCIPLKHDSEEPPPAPLHQASRALLVVRAQPFHRGHLALAQRAFALAEELVLVVAAADRAYTARDPFTAGERLQLVRAGLGDLSARTWLIALPAPTWPAMALAQLAFVAPTYDTIVAHNPILRAMAEQQGKHVESLPEPFALAAQAVSATRVRARLAQESAGTWLSEFVPNATAALLCATPALAERCALIARAEG